MRKKNFVKEIITSFSSKKTALKYFKTEKENAIKFILMFVIVFVLLNIITIIVPLKFFEKPIADTTLKYIQLKGIEGSVNFSEPITITTNTGLTIIISYLCTGLLELFVLWASIISSKGISWKNRTIGIIFAFVGTMIFNFIRIFTTIEFILNKNLKIVEFVHDILFRITLLIVIVGLYAVWFWWATNKQKQ